MENNFPAKEVLKEVQNIQALREVVGDHTTHETSVDVRPTADAIAKPRLSLLQSFDPLFSNSPGKANKADGEGVLNHLVDIENVFNSPVLTNKNNEAPQNHDSTHADVTGVTPQVESVSKLFDCSFVDGNPITTPSQKSFTEENSQGEDKQIISLVDRLKPQLVIDDSESDLSTSRLEAGEKTLFEESDIEFEDAVDVLEEKESKNTEIHVFDGANVSGYSATKDNSISETNLDASLPEVVRSTKESIPEEGTSLENTPQIRPKSDSEEVTDIEQGDISHDSTRFYFEKTSLEEKTVICNTVEDSSVSPPAEQTVTTSEPHSPRDFQNVLEIKNDSVGDKTALLETQKSISSNINTTFIGEELNIKVESDVPPNHNIILQSNKPPNDDETAVKQDLEANTDPSTKFNDITCSSNLNKTFDAEVVTISEAGVALEKSQVLNESDLQCSQINKDLVIPIAAGPESVISNSISEKTRDFIETQETNNLPGEKSLKQGESPKQESSGQYLSRIKDFITSVVSPKRESALNIDINQSPSSDEITSQEDPSSSELTNLPPKDAISSGNKELSEEIAKENLNLSESKLTQSKVSGNIVVDESEDKETANPPQVRETTTENNKLNEEIPKESLNISESKLPVSEVSENTIIDKTENKETVNPPQVEETAASSPCITPEVETSEPSVENNSEVFLVDGNPILNEKVNNTETVCITPEIKTSEPSVENNSEVFLVDGNDPIVNDEKVNNTEIVIKEDTIPVTQLPLLKSPNKPDKTENIFTTESTKVSNQEIVFSDVKEPTSDSITPGDSDVPVEDIVREEKSLFVADFHEHTVNTVTSIEGIVKREESAIKVSDLKNIGESKIEYFVEENTDLSEEVKKSKNLQNQCIKTTVTEVTQVLPSSETCDKPDKSRRSESYSNVDKFLFGKRNTRSLSPKQKANINRGRSASPLASGINTETASLANKDIVQSSKNVGEVEKIEDTKNLISNKRGSGKHPNNLENSKLNVDCFAVSHRNVKHKLLTPTRYNLKEKTQLSGVNQLIDSELIPSPIKSILDCVPILDFEDEKENKEGAVKPVKYKMSDLMDKLSSLHQEISDLKLQLNASQQEKASLELEIRQKEEVIIKTQAEALKKEQDYVHDIKSLKEQLAEKSKLIEKDSTKELELELKRVKAREAELSSELSARNTEGLNFKKIMEEYEKTISARIADFEKLKAEHETATKHLANLEFAFADVHQKYERSKAIIEGFKTNEDTLKHNLSVLEQTIKHHEEKYDSLKAHAKAQIEKSNKEIITLRNLYEAENNKLAAIIKRLEIKCSTLEASLEQKTKECSALAALCDEVTGQRV